MHVYSLVNKTAGSQLYSVSGCSPGNQQEFIPKVATPTTSHDPDCNYRFPIIKKKSVYLCLNINTRFGNFKLQDNPTPRLFSTMFGTSVPALGSAKGFLWLCALVFVLVRLLRCSALPLRQLRRIVLRADYLANTPPRFSQVHSITCTCILYGMYQDFLGESKRYTIMVSHNSRQAPHLAVAVITDLWQENPRRATSSPVL